MRKSCTGTDLGIVLTEIQAGGKAEYSPNGARESDPNISAFDPSIIGTDGRYRRVTCVGCGQLMDGVATLRCLLRCADCDGEAARGL